MTNMTVTTNSASYMFNGDPRQSSIVPNIVTSNNTNWGQGGAIFVEVPPKPDHEFRVMLDDSGESYYDPWEMQDICGDCQSRSPWRSDRAAHLYVIREWGLG